MSDLFKEQFLFLGDSYKLDVVNIEHSFFKKLKKREGRGSLKMKYKVLLSIFKHAVKWKVIKAGGNPMDNQEKPKVTRKQQKDFYLTHKFPMLFELLKEYREDQ